MVEPMIGAKGMALIVEDEVLIAMDTERILQDMGFGGALIATTLAEAEQALRGAEPIAIALVDLSIDGASAVPLLAELRRLGIPAVIASGSVGLAGLTKADAGTPRVCKPYSEVELQDAVRRALGQA